MKDLKILNNIDSGSKPVTGSKIGTLTGTICETCSSFKQQQQQKQKLSDFVTGNTEQWGKR